MRLGLYFACIVMANELAHLSDEALVELCRVRGSGDSRPFTELFHRHQRFVWRTCYRFVRAQNLISYLPRVLAAVLILVVGAWLAQALGKVAQAAVASMGVEFHEGIGRAVRGLLLVVTAVLAVEQLGLNLTFLTGALTNLLTVVVAGLALAFGLGGRDVTRNVLAGYYARDQFAPGEGLVVDGEVGTLESIGTVNTQIAIGEEILVVPNTRLTEGTVRVRKTAPVEQESTNRYESASHPES